MKVPFCAVFDSFILIPTYCRTAQYEGKLAIITTSDFKLKAAFNIKTLGFTGKAYKIVLTLNDENEVKSVKDLTIRGEDRPGTLADTGEVLGKVNINIEGIAGCRCEGKRELHILIKDTSVARRVLEEIHIEVIEEREVLVVDVKDQPGELGRITRKIANAGVNINLVYLATNNRLVIGADDLEKAKAIFDNFLS
ncbi:MAG: ACT domain-containing protein [Candidatus Hodarchaeota archaeon]